MKQKILILSTGGTIACSESAQGLVPTVAAKDILALLPSAMDGDFQLTFLELFQMDSSSIGPSHWLSIAEVIDRRYGEFDGFVITHGTDTMAYTASALSFLLAGRKKPVVLTGSQLPASAPGSDAADNLKTAFLAFYTPLSGVMIAFCGRLIRGCRASKLRTQSFCAFESINAAPLADFSKKATQTEGGYQPPESGCRSLTESFPSPKAFDAALDNTACCSTSSPEAAVFRTAAAQEDSDPRYPLRLDSHVALLKLTPGMPPAFLTAIAQSGLHGIVLELFGAGNFPSEDEALMNALHGLAKRDIVFVTKSQCPFEPCDSQVYAAGQALSFLRPICAGDMTAEAALTKLMWALGQSRKPERVRQLFFTNLAGEICL